MCFSANAGRRRFDHRLAVCGSSNQELREQLASAPRGHVESSPRIGFVFTGQGSQYAGMGGELFNTHPAFRATLERCDELLRSHLERPLLDVLHGSHTDLLDQTAYTQPALFAVEIALAELWRSWGIQPAAVMGHSIGEYAAACVAGAIPLEQALPLVAARGQLMQTLQDDGAMAAVHAGEDLVAAAIAPYVAELAIAAVNGPSNVVISGRKAALQAATAELERQGLEVTPLRVSHAFHSPLMDPMLDALEDAAAGVPYAPPRVPLVSNLSGQPVSDGELGAGYWRRHARQPVRFAAGLASLEALGCDLLLEIGPKPTLRALAAGVSELEVLPSLGRPGSDWQTILSALAQLHVRGASLDWQAFDAPYQRRKVVLPTYPFQRQRYWLPLRSQDAAPAPAADQAEPLLGHRVRSPLSVQLFETRLGAGASAYLADHQLFGQPIVPATAYLETMLAAADAVSGGQPCTVADLRIHTALPVVAGGRTVQTTVDTEPVGWRASVFSLDGEEWVRHASARLSPEPAQPANDSLAAARERCGREVDRDEHFRLCAEAGLEVGPAFQGLRRAWLGDSEVVAQATLPDGLDPGPYRLHPALLDACLQPLMRLTSNGASVVPVAAARFGLLGRPARTIWAHITVRSQTDDEITVDATVWNDDGSPLARIDGLRLLQAGRRDEPLYQLAWRPQPLASPAASPRPCAMHGSEADIEALRQAGIDCSAYHSREPADIVVYVAPQPPEGDLEAQQRAICEPLLELIQALAAGRSYPRLYVATRGGQVAGHEPLNLAHAPVWGLVRVAAQEHPELRCTLVDLEPEAGLAGLAAELAAGDAEDQVCWRGEQRLVARIAPAEPLDGRPVRLTVGRRGDLDSLRLEPIEPRAPGPGEVQVRIRAAGLNFREVLSALGMYPGDPGPLGSECAGTVEQAGPGVTRFAPGDAVLAIAPGTLSSLVTVDQRRLAPMPPNLTFEQTATLPLVFGTVIQGLEVLARLQPGERVLIHAGAGGIGMAAIQVALAIGAEVYATAGSPAKRALLEQMGVQATASSRTPEFAAELLAATGGRGVDVLLNSLSAELTPANLAVLAPRGRLVELGKRDIWSPERMAQERPDVGYFVLDLNELPLDPLAELVGHVADRAVRGDIRPLPLRQFALADAPSVFRLMARAEHTGKLVFHPPALPASQLARPDGAYVISGGGGALGRLIAEWLVEGGARSVALLGRHLDMDALRPTVAGLEARGASVALLPADVAERDELAAALAKVRAEHGPIRGFIHAAGVLDDAPLALLDWRRCWTAMAPKIAGAWHAHELTLDDPIDLFLLMSSAAALLGSKAQANYAAGNTYLDALAHYRRARSLPACSVEWGPWAAGMAQDLGDRTAALGMQPIEPDRGLAALRTILAGHFSQVAYLPIDWRTHAAAEGPRPLLAELLAGQPASATTAAAQAGDALASLTDEAARLLGCPAASLDPSKPLVTFGLDSLLAIDLRQRVLKRLGAAPPLTQFLKASLAELAEATEAQLPNRDIDRLLSEIEALSDGDVAALLEPPPA